MAAGGMGGGRMLTRHYHGLHKWCMPVRIQTNSGKNNVHGKIRGVRRRDSRLQTGRGCDSSGGGKIGLRRGWVLLDSTLCRCGVHRDGTAARGCPILIFSYRWWCGVGKYQPGPLDRQTPYRIAISISTAACDVEVLANEEGEGGREGEAGISVDDAIDAGSGSWKRWRGSSPHLDLPHHNTRPSSI